MIVFATDEEIIQSQFAIYEAVIDPESTVSSECNKGKLFELKKFLTEFDFVRTSFCLSTNEILVNATKGEALFIIVFDEVVEYKVVDDLVTFTENEGFGSNLVRQLNDVNGLPVTFKVDENRNIYDHLPIGSLEIENITDLSLIDTNQTYDKIKVLDLVNQYSKDGKIELVKSVQNTLYDKFIEFFYDKSIEFDFRPEKIIDGDFGSKTASVIQNAFSDDYDEVGYLTHEQVIKFLFDDLIKFKSNGPEIDPAIDPEDQAAGTDKERIEEDGSEEKLDTNNSPATLQNIDKVTEGNNSLENQQSLDAVIDEKEKLEEYNKQLIRRAVEQQEEILNLKIDIQNQKDEAQSFKNTSIIDLLEKFFPLDKIQYKGMRSNGEQVNITVSEPTLLEDNFNQCKISPSQSLEEALKVILEDPDCFRLTLKEYEEEISFRNDPPRTFYLKDKTLQIPVLEKQSPIITNLKSLPLEDFEADKKDMGSCVVGVRILRDGTPIQQNDGKNHIPIYLEEENGAFYFKAYKISDAKIDWEGTTLEFVDARQDKKNRQICSIQEHGSITILTEKESKSALVKEYATISRSGGLILNFVPIERSKGSKLIVILNEFVGERGAVHGLNDAILEPTVQLTQKTYFEGFLNGLGRFIASNSNFEELIIYTSSASEENRNYGVIYRNEILEETASEFNIFADKYIQSTLLLGREGTPKNIRRFLKQLRKEYKDLKIVSFGPSGAKKDDACRDMNGYSEGDITFFNIWARPVIDDLTEKKTVEAIVPKVFFKCEELDRLFGFRRNDNVDFDEISKPVYTMLKQILGDK